MRKTCAATTLALILVTATANAEGIGVGIGAFGGISIPIVNDLSKQGAVYGVRAPVKIVPLVTIEPFYSLSSLGDVEESFGGPVTYTRDGGEVTAFGASVLLTMGEGTTNFFPFGGIGSYKIERSGAEEISEIGYNFGLGISVSPESWRGFSFDVRGEAVMIATGDTSQKFGNITAGVSYQLIPGSSE
jgi:hypothetical protein